MEDLEKIFGEFFVGAIHNAVENQEFSTICSDKEVDEFESESSKAVFVGNHKRELVSLQKSFQ